MDNKAWKEIIKRENKKTDWEKVEANVGMEVAGYRFGGLHPRGYSVNHATGEAEPGYSMASVMGLAECGSFAACSNGRKRVYVIGKIAGVGSDDEVCLSDVRVVTAAEYREFVKNNKAKKEALRQNVQAVIKKTRLSWNDGPEGVERMVINGEIYDSDGRLVGFSSQNWL